ncbi:MAG: sulfate permease [Ignavibacteriales bacterium]|jgi:SulP family sulfate permease|nr:MAG: sulfate permease [Ignavibacterium sp.]MCZ2267874.1 sulfate permease [Ignavibacteriales bacterium]MDX9713579.1 sulfate permease [Ignavibacteriaceae bacterium]MEB2355202.1 sulfate permease [Ignavibacteriales bacterium]HMN16711.1 sulfate permease [Ignavibacteriaceae bacterium]
MLKPKLFTTLRNYSKQQFISDATAGVIVGIVALPLAIAFGIASGVTPEKGIITAIIAGFVISFFGGSRVQIGGPTGAFIIVVYGIVQQYGTTGLAIATIMAGIILVIMGLVKFGSLIKFIPYPVVVGFTSGIALLIFSTQIKDFFGLQLKDVPAEFHEKWLAYFQYFSTFNYNVVIIALLALLIMILWPRITHKIPGSLIAIIATTVIVIVFELPVDTIGSRFGEISSNLPSPNFYKIDLGVIRNLIGPATVIAILAAIESLLSAVVADGMIGGKHRSNMELVAQGLANIITPVFGGIPATGAIARTATNIKNGGRTPVAGIFHSITLLLIMLFFGSYARLIPMATLAAILVVVAYNMSEWRAFKSLLKSPKSDVVVLVTTFLLTVIFDLTIAIEIGMVLSVLLFMKRMSEVSNVSVITRELEDEEDKPDPNATDKKKIPEEVEVFEINGPLFFGAAKKFKDAMSIIEKPPKVRIIRMRNVPAIDATGLQTLKDFYNDSKKHKTHMILSGVHTQPLYAMTQAGIFDLYGEENIHGNIDDALDRAREILGLPKLGRPKDFIPTVKRDKN